MNEKSKIALRNLKFGGIYTPILFGIIFISIDLIMNVIDPSGKLGKQLNKIPFYDPPSRALGGCLIFWGINTFIYFQRFIKTLKTDDINV